MSGAMDQIMMLWCAVQQQLLDRPYIRLSVDTFLNLCQEGEAYFQQQAR